MEHLQGVEEARYYVDQLKKGHNLTDIEKQLDPTKEQENANCGEYAKKETTSYVLVSSKHPSLELLHQIL